MIAQQNHGFCSMLFSLRVQLYGFEHAIGEEVNSAYPAKVILLLPDML